MMEREGFVEISRGATPGPRPMPHVPIPPQHPHGMPASQNRPNIVNANPNPHTNQPRTVYPHLAQHNQQQHQQQQHQQQQQQQQQHRAGIPPPPPRDIVPLRLQKGPIVQLSDIRKERLTEVEAREDLSEYFVFRLERADTPGVYDSDGEEVKPTWMNAYLTEMTGVSKKEALKQVRYLNETSQSLSQKLNALIPAQLRQLDKVHEELTRRERDPKYETVLVQLDRRLEKKPENRSRERDRMRDGGPRKHKEYRGRKDQREYTTVFGKVKPAGSKDRKKILETVSITAYYKRTPIQNVDALALVAQRNVEKAKQLQPPQPQHTFPAQQPFQHQHQQPLQLQQQPHQPQQLQLPYQPHQEHPQQQMRPQPAIQYPQIQQAGQLPAQRALPANVAFAQQHDTPANLPSSQRSSMNHHKQNAHAPIQIIQSSKKVGKKASRSKSRSSSPASVSSRLDSSDDSDDMSIRTPDSSHSSSQQSSSHKMRRRGSKRGRRRYVEEPGHFGVSASVEPHKTRRYEQQHRISEDHLPGMAGPTKYSSLLPSDLDIEQLKTEFYEAGRAHERAETRAIEQFSRPPSMMQQQQQQQPQRLRLTERPMSQYLSDYEVMDEPAMPRAARPPPPRPLQRHHSSRMAYPDEYDSHEDTLGRVRHLDLEDRVAYHEPRYVAGVDDAMLQRADRRRAREIAEDRIMRQQQEMEEAIMAREEEEFRLTESAREMDREYRLGGGGGGSIGGGRRYGRRREPDSDVTFADLDPPPSPSNPFAPRPQVRRRATSGAFPTHRYEV